MDAYFKPSGMESLDVVGFRRRNLERMDLYRCPECNADYTLTIQDGFLCGDCPNQHGSTIYDAVTKAAHA